MRIACIACKASTELQQTTWLTSILTNICGSPSWLDAHASASNQKLLSKLASVTANQQVQGANLFCRQDPAARPELSPITSFVHALSHSSPASLNNPENKQPSGSNDQQDSVHNTLLQLRSAFIMTKLASFLNLSSTEESMDDFIWNHMEHLAMNITSPSKPGATRTKAMQKEEQLLCTVVMETLLPIIQALATHPQQSQHPGRAACFMLKAVILHCSASAEQSGSGSVAVPEPLLESGGCFILWVLAYWLFCQYFILTSINEQAVDHFDGRDTHQASLKLLCLE